MVETAQDTRKYQSGAAGDSEFVEGDWGTGAGDYFGDIEAMGSMLAGRRLRRCGRRCGYAKPLAFGMNCATGRSS